MGSVHAFTEATRRVRGKPENGCFRMFPALKHVRNMNGEWVYAVGLPDGRVKVGIARLPRERIQTHWRTHGGLLWAHVSGFVPRHQGVLCFRAKSMEVERAILARLSRVAERIGRTECFRGLDKGLVLRVCREEIAAARATEQAA